MGCDTRELYANIEGKAGDLANRSRATQSILTKSMFQWLYISSIVYCPAAYFTKVTLLLLVSRIFTVKEKVVKGIHIFIIALLVAYLPIQIAKTVVCIPIQAYWNPSIKNATCLDQQKLFISDICLAIFTDFVIFLLPVPLIWSLRMPLRKKIKFAVLLGCGGVATAVTIWRLQKVIGFRLGQDTTVQFVPQNIST